MQLNLLVGGPVEYLPSGLLQAKKNERWVGADMGAVRLCQAKIKPLLAVGDFDSATEEQVKLVKEASQAICSLPAKKDYTDTEVALLEIERRYHPEQIIVYGATGGRSDHFLANLFSVLRLDFPTFVPKVCFKDCQNEIRFYLPGSYTLTKLEEMSYLSFISLTPVTKLTLPNEKYQLFEQDLSLPTAYVSNEFVGESASFSFDSGVLCVIQSKDDQRNNGRQ